MEMEKIGPIITWVVRDAARVRPNGGVDGQGRAGQGKGGEV